MSEKLDGQALRRHAARVAGELGWGDNSRSEYEAFTAGYEAALHEAEVMIEKAAAMAARRLRGEPVTAAAIELVIEHAWKVALTPYANHAQTLIPAAESENTKSR